MTTLVPDSDRDTCPRHILQCWKVDRRILDAPNTVSRALLLMIADNGADGGHEVILKEHFSRFHQAVFLKQLDHRRDRRVNRTALLTAGLFTVETAICLRDNM